MDHEETKTKEIMDWFIERPRSKIKRKEMKWSYVIITGKKPKRILLPRFCYSPTDEHYIHMKKDSIYFSVAPYYENESFDAQIFLESPMEKEIEEIEMKYTSYSSGLFRIGIHNKENLFFLDLFSSLKIHSLAFGYNKKSFKHRKKIENILLNKIWDRKKTQETTFNIKFDSKHSHIQISLNKMPICTLSEEMMCHYGTAKKRPKPGPSFADWKWFLLTSSIYGEKNANYSSIRLKIKKLHKQNRIKSLCHIAYESSHPFIFSTKLSYWYSYRIKEKIYSFFPKHTIDKFEKSFRFETKTNIFWYEYLPLFISEYKMFSYKKPLCDK